MKKKLIFPLDFLHHRAQQTLPCIFLLQHRPQQISSSVCILPHNAQNLWPQLLERLMTLFSRLHIPWITQLVSPKIYPLKSDLYRYITPSNVWTTRDWCSTFCSTACNIIVYRVYSVDMDKFNRACSFFNSGNKCHHVSTLCSIVQNKFHHVSYFREHWAQQLSSCVLLLQHCAQQLFFLCVPSYALRWTNFIGSPFF